MCDALFAIAKTVYVWMAVAARLVVALAVLDVAFIEQDVAGRSQLSSALSIDRLFT